MYVLWFSNSIFIVSCLKFNFNLNASPWSEKDFDKFRECIRSLWALFRLNRKFHGNQLVINQSLRKEKRIPNMVNKGRPAATHERAHHSNLLLRGQSLSFRHLPLFPVSPCLVNVFFFFNIKAEQKRNRAKKHGLF